MNWDLVIGALPLVKRVCWRFHKEDDGRGLDVLIRCAQLYDPTKGAFNGYAYRALVNAYTRRDVQHAPLTFDVPLEIVEHLDVDLYTILQGIPVFDRWVLMLRHGYGLTYAQIGRLLDVSRTTAYRYEVEAMKRARSAARRES